MQKSIEIEKLDRKYAQLLLQKCLCFKNTDTLLIEYMTHEHDNFPIGYITRVHALHRLKVFIYVVKNWLGCF